jgi:hypothetical protein
MEVADGDWAGVLEAPGGGVALLDAVGYTTWQHAFRFTGATVPARWRADDGRWLPPRDVPVDALRSQHRRARSLDEAAGWPDLPIDDVDRFCRWYPGLEPASAQFFEAKLRRDEETERALAGLQALDEEVDAGDEVLWAGCAAMFARGVPVLGRSGAPERIPGPLDDDIRAVLDAAASDAPDEAGHDEKTLAAAGLVRLAFAGFPALKQAPGWARAAFRDLEISGLGAGMAAARKASRRSSDDLGWMD